MSTIFSKIVSGEIPANIVYQDELVTAFRGHQPASAHPHFNCAQQGNCYGQRPDRGG